MKVRGRVPALVLGMGVVALSAAWGQSPPTSAKVDTLPLDLTPPGRYHIPSVLEPARRVTLVATTDGVVRSQAAQAGAAVREGQEVVVMDRAEASARLKIAQAEVKEQQAAVNLAKAVTVSGDPSAASKAGLATAQARHEAAQGRAELAQLAFDRCALRAPFSGRVLDSFVSDGQFVTKGTVLAELADVTSLRTVVPVERSAATVGANLTVFVEGQPVQGKIQAVLPLSEAFGILRELSSPLASAAVVLSNPGGSLEPGQRVTSPAAPVAPIATIPTAALKTPDPRRKDKSADETPTVQVVRNEYVTTVKVRVLGHPGPEQVQVTGPFRPTDALIVSSSVPLLAGTLLRFNGSVANAVEGTSPNPAQPGVTADLTPPAAGSRTAPIGAPGSALPKGRTPSANSASGSPPAAIKPAAKSGANSVPF